MATIKEIAELALSANATAKKWGPGFCSCAKEHCIAIGDDENNLEMFEQLHMTVAYC